MRVTVVIPTVDGREEYLARCMSGYQQHTDAEVQFVVVPDKPTCGIAWRVGAELARRVLLTKPDDFLHFTADDIVPAVGWLPPFAEAVARGRFVPCGLVVAPVANTLDSRGMPVQGAEFSQANFFERPGSDENTVPDWYPTTHDSEYPSIPFCSWSQWDHIGPMIAGHYGTDRWFGLRARQAGYVPVARHGARFYHYAAHRGRVPQYAGWTHQDLITFDLNVAFPEYAAGRLEPASLHPERGTAEGRRVTREWLERHTPGPYFWEDPTLEEEYR